MPWQETSPVDQRERFIDDHWRGLYPMTELCERYSIRLQVAGPLRGGGSAGPPRPEPGPAPLSAPDPPGRRPAPLCGPAGASQLGAGEDSAMARAPASGRSLARRQHGGRSARAPRPGEEAPAAPAASPSRGRPPDDRPAQRSVDHRLQGPLPDPGRDLLLPPDDRRSAWLRLGIQHQRILPAHPQQNGAHERLHKTLKAGAIRPPPRDPRGSAAGFQHLPDRVQRGAAP